MNKLTFDLKKTNGKVKYMNAVNNGPVPAGVRDSYSNFEAYKEADISFARNHDAAFYSPYGGEHIVDVHRIFKNFDADENDPASYVFEPTDEYLLNTIEAGTKIFYRLGAAIEHRYQYGTRVPADFEKWARICEHIIMHYNYGWANGFELNIEYWEIWNEPDCGIICWGGTKEQFADLYCTVAAYLKKKFPHLKIGGPAMASVWSESYVDCIFSEIKRRNAPLDFYSFHCYGKDPSHFVNSINVAKEQLAQYGFENVELILNEWNYIKGWSGAEWNYSLETEKNLKGSSFISAVMCVSQECGLDMLMYYDARPCGMNGMFAQGTFEPLKGYYPFVMFKDILKLENYLKSATEVEDIYSCAANNGEETAIMLTYYNDTELPEKDVSIEINNASGEKEKKISIYLLDEKNDMVCIRDEYTTAEKFALHIKMEEYSTYFIKISDIL